MIKKNINKKSLYQFGLPFCALLLISACFAGKNYNMKPTATSVDIAANAAAELRAGNYKLDLSHASLIFRVNHLGLSRYNLRFKRFDAKLYFDPQNPVASKVTATIDPTSIETDYPDSKKHNFNAALYGKDWLNSKKFKNITFTSNSVELTGPNTARIHGQLNMHGVTLPLILYTMFNGGYHDNPMDPSGSRIGFSARGALNRSDFGIAYGIPAEGSNMGVGDMIEFAIEAEFVKPTK